MHSNPPIVLVFSGLDPSGGAGIQADIETLASHGCHACPIITNLTVQDTTNIKNYSKTDVDLIIQQAEYIQADCQISAIKIGLLGNAKLIIELGKFIQKLPEIPVILDPILASGGGTSLADSQTINALINHLIPYTHFLTPNHLEARTLANVLGCQSTQYKDIANVLLELQCHYVLITGGHENTDLISNVLFHAQNPPETFQWQRIKGEFHGTGCTLSSSIAGLIAQGHSPLSAVHQAQEFTWSSLKHGYAIGKGQRIPNRFFWANADQNNINNSNKDHHE